MSPPSSRAVKPAATAAAAPPDEPPGVRSRFHGLRVTPKSSLSVCQSAQSGGTFDLPNTIAPAALSRATGTASRSGTCSAQTAAPHVVRNPSVSNWSLIVIGSPCSGLRESLCADPASASSASLRARSASSVTTAFSSEKRSIRARYDSSSSPAPSSRRRMRAASSAAGRNAGSTRPILRVQPLECRRPAAPDGGFIDVAVREAEPVGSLKEVRDAGLDREDLLGIYRVLLITRGIEERGHILYRQGKIPGSFYTGRGNEAAAVGVATAMGAEDVGTPLQRDMGVHITRGVEPWRIFAQYMGRVDGPTRGRDGNVHLADANLGLHAMVSHLPAMLPVAVGMGLAFRIREEKRVAVAWCGEGAAARGDAHEGMNFAGVRRLPVVFVIDNNQWAYSTPTHLGYAIEHLADRAAAYGFEGVVVDGTDVLAVYREARSAIEKAREGGGPTLIESVTLRMEGHAVHDDAYYVPKEMMERWAESDPLERFRTWLRVNAEMTDSEEDEISAEVKRTLNEALRRAEESPLPDVSTLTEGVYASAEDLDTPHHK